MNESPSNDDDSREKCLRVVTGSRLHFGLLDTASPFGGVGVMVEEPATEIVLIPSQQFGCEHDAADRVRGIAERVSVLAGAAELPACRIEIRRRSPSHTGMGSGTQLALAVADALCRFTGIALAPAELALKVAQRGQRSAVGVHGYFEGGLIFEFADEQCAINPLQLRAEPPSQWRVGLFQPRAACDRVSGSHEREQFSRLASASADVRAGLSQLVTNHMLPAAASGDFQMFVDSVEEYNYQSGMLFESVQHGAYNGRSVSDLIQSLKDHGARGVGQSSWGPGVFAWFKSPTEATMFVQSFPTDLASHLITQVRNEPRIVETISI